MRTDIIIISQIIYNWRKQLKSHFFIQKRRKYEVSLAQATFCLSIYITIIKEWSSARRVLMPRQADRPPLYIISISGSSFISKKRPGFKHLTWGAWYQQKPQSSKCKTTWEASGIGSWIKTLLFLLKPFSISRWDIASMNEFLEFC